VASHQAKQVNATYQKKPSKSLSSAEYAATSRAKREGTAKGKQFVAQPKSIAKKVAKFRK
jgi:hypothetical protein